MKKSNNKDLIDKFIYEPMTEEEARYLAKEGTKNMKNLSEVLSEEEYDEFLAKMQHEVDPKNFKYVTSSLTSLNRIIRTKRLYDGYTQEELCKKIKVNRSTYSRYENGERQIPNEVMNRILKELNLIISIESRDEDFDYEMLEKDRD